jgi:mono/diheme cytochrome c family protein
LTLAILGDLAAVMAQATSPDPIWSGVYTLAQAERGRTVVQHHCGECHQEDLSGGEGPALAGSTFMLKWETHTVERLFQKIRDTMPSKGSTDVTDEEKLDSVAYILQQNGFPAGAKDLSNDASLSRVRLVPKDGPAPPRSGALVRVIGCLQQDGTNQWTVVNSTDPAITTLDPMSAEDMQSAAAMPAGSQTIQLLSVFPSPAALRGHKVIVKGLLIRLPAGDRINVTELASLAPRC